MSLSISKVQDANVYINGTSTHGQASEVSLPEIQFSKSEYKALGLLGVQKFFNGFDALEATIKWNYPENDVQIACANPRKVVELQVRSSKAVYVGGGIAEEQPIIVHLKGTPNNHGVGSFKAKEDTDLSTKFDIIYLKQEVNGREIVEIDVQNNIFRIDGVDQMAKYKQNLGI